MSVALRDSNSNLIPRGGEIIKNGIKTCNMSYRFKAYLNATDHGCQATYLQENSIRILNKGEWDNKSTTLVLEIGTMIFQND